MDRTQHNKSLDDLYGNVMTSHGVISNEITTMLPNVGHDIKYADTDSVYVDTEYTRTPQSMYMKIKSLVKIMRYLEATPKESQLIDLSGSHTFKTNFNFATMRIEPTIDEMTGEEPK